jgi:hypothetical protein
MRFCVPLLFFVVLISGRRCAALEVDDLEIPAGKPVKLPAGAKFQTGPAEDLYKIAISRDGQFGATAGHDGKVKIWDATKGKLVTTIVVSNAQCHGVDFSADGKSIYACSDDGAVHQFEIAGGKELRKLEGHEGQIGTVAVAPDGRRLASSDSTGIRIWDLGTGKQIHLMKGHRVPGEIAPGALSPLAIDAVGFSADGRTLITEANDETARLWDTHAGREIRMIPNHDGSTAAVALSANGEWGVSTRGSISLGAAPRVRLWEPATGRIRRSLMGHQGDITCVAFSPDSRYVFSGSQDHTLRQWEVDSGIELRRFNLSSAPMSVQCAADGKSALTISISEGVVAWDLTQAPVTNLKTEMAAMELAWEALSNAAYDTRSVAFNYYCARPAAEAFNDLAKRLEELSAKMRDDAQLAKLIQQLDDPSYSTRARAADELEQLGADARPALTAALDNPSPEVRVRAAALLNALGGFSDARPVLAIEILARLQVSDARTLLAKIGATQAPYAAHARTVLARISQ